jgi:hypothetical protein
MRNRLQTVECPATTMLHLFACQRLQERAHSLWRFAELGEAPLMMERRGPVRSLPRHFAASRRNPERAHADVTRLALGSASRFELGRRLAPGLQFSKASNRPRPDPTSTYESATFKSGPSTNATDISS